MKKLIVVMCMLVAAAWAVAAPLEVSLQAFKVVRDADGGEALVSADVAEPGDVIEYQATYTNTSGKALSSVTPELPIPSGLTYLDGSDRPKADRGSLGGGVFAALPMVDSNGATVPSANIRAFRWSVEALSPAASVTVRLRATVNR